MLVSVGRGNLCLHSGVKPKVGMVKTDKTLKKLVRKREMVLDWLSENGVKLEKDATAFDVLRKGYELCGKTFKVKKGTPAALHAHFGNLITWAGLNQKVKDDNYRVWKAAQPPKVEPLTAKQFYASYTWRKLRYEILKRDGARCQLCGARASDGAVLHVDHIKPLRKFWSLRLAPDNLQTLCNVCNHGKGNWDETDWRGG